MADKLNKGGINDTAYTTIDASPPPPSLEGSKQQKEKMRIEKKKEWKSKETNSQLAIITAAIFFAVFCVTASNYLKKQSRYKVAAL